MFIFPTMITITPRATSLSLYIYIYTLTHLSKNIHVYTYTYLFIYIIIYVYIYIIYIPMIKKKLRHFRILGCGLCWLAWIVVNYGLDLTNNFRNSFFIKSIKMRFPICCTDVIITGFIQFFKSCALSSEWHRNTAKSSFCNWWREWQTVLPAISNFLERWIVRLSCFLHSPNWF